MEEMQSEDNTSINTGFKTNYFSGIGTHMVLLSIGQQNTYTSNHYRQHTSQSSGGYYIGSQAPNVNTNGVCWVRKMAYIPYTDITYAKKLFTFPNAITKACSYFHTGMSMGSFLSAVNQGWPSISQSVPGLSKALGSAAFGRAMAAIMIYDYCAGVLNKNTDLYNKAKDQQKGILKVVYSVSYNGSWYECPTACDCIWTSYPTAYEPNTYLGTGKYTPDYKKSPTVIK